MMYLKSGKYLGIDPLDVPIVPVGDDDVPEVFWMQLKRRKLLIGKLKLILEKQFLTSFRWYDKYGINDIFSHLSAPINK